MAVIGAHRDDRIATALGAATCLLAKQDGDQRDHVHTAIKMVILEEGAGRFDRDIAEMREMDRSAKAVAIAITSLSGREPSEPAHSVIPFASDGTASNRAA